MSFKAGDLVEVRSAVEILATLDDNGCLDGMPFMPEMLQYCGRQFRIFKAGHKTCDSTWYGVGRRMKNIVFLENLRCDGAAHMGCEAECLTFWNTAWLARPGKRSASNVATTRDEQWLQRTVHAAPVNGSPRFRCQATEHLRASKPIKSYDIWQYVEDITSGNASVREVVRAVFLKSIWRLRFLGVGWSVATRLYDRLHRAIYGGPDPHVTGRIPEGKPTPDVQLALRAGERVYVKSLEEITATLNTRNRNKGLAFNPEMAPFCGGEHQVHRRVTRIVDEKTGELITMKSPCITLENVYCEARYHPDALLCPRRIPPYFREAWLTRGKSQ
jgi:hypothetical protein